MADDHPSRRGADVASVRAKPGVPGRVTGRNSLGLAAILAAPNGPTYRQISEWVRLGLLHPQVVATAGERSAWRWPPSEARVAIAMGRLVNAGVRPPQAEVVARHPRGGPVVLGPGVIISLFDLPTTVDAALEAAS